MANVPDRGTDLSRKIDTVSGTRFIAKCGHEDATSYFAGTECGNCTNDNKIKKNKEIKKQTQKRKQREELLSMFRTV